MKSFQQFMSESVNISGDFNGTLIINGTEDQSTPVGESYCADIVWEGKIYRMEFEGHMISKNDLTEALQNEYPGAIVHNIYPVSEQKSSLKIKSTQRYQPEKLTWGE
jgi:hypothetical protein